MQVRASQLVTVAKWANTRPRIPVSAMIVIWAHFPAPKVLPSVWTATLGKCNLQLVKPNANCVVTAALSNFLGDKIVRSVLQGLTQIVLHLYLYAALALLANFKISLSKMLVKTVLWENFNPIQGNQPALIAK